MFIATAWDLASSRRRRRAPPTLSTGRSLSLSLSWIIGSSWHTSQGRIVSIYSRYICYMLYASWFIKWTFECFTMGRRTLRCESSKGKQISIRSCQRRENCKRKTQKEVVERGGECIKTHRLLCCCFVFECIREEVYFGAMLEFAAFCGTASPPPTWTAPTRASLSRCCSLATWHHHSGQTVKPR